MALCEMGTAELISISEPAALSDNTMTLADELRISLGARPPFAEGRGVSNGNIRKCSREQNR